MHKENQLTLTPVQLALREALSTHDSKFANMYSGALIALTVEGNPERFSQCAQSLRELVQRLTYVQNDTNLGGKVKELQSKWNKCKNSHGTASDGGFKMIADELDAFFAWVDESRASRTKQAKKILDDLDPMFASLPNDIIEGQVEVWLDFRKYFENVAHHNHFPDEVTFKEQVDAFSSFLLNLLRPKTSENFAEIQKLIDEGESNAEPRNS